VRFARVTPGGTVTPTNATMQIYSPPAVLRIAISPFGHGFAAFANEQGLRLNADVEAIEPIKAAFDMGEAALSDGAVAYARGIGTLEQHTQVVSQSMEIEERPQRRRPSR
jgi:hypothetical protein